MATDEKKESSKGERLFVGSVWVILGLLVSSVGAYYLFIKGEPAEGRTDFVSEYIWLVGGALGALTGIGYWFMPGVRRYLDKQAEGLEPGGRDRKNLSLLRILRCFKK
jgi:hypothetical protein